MSEINNNITNYGYKIDRIDHKKDSAAKQQAETPKEVEDAQYLYDTGVLGLSQIHVRNGENIAKSVDEAVNMAEKQPVRLGCSERIFDDMFKRYIDAGLNETDAYLKALGDEEEFLAISSSYER